MVTANRGILEAEPLRRASAIAEEVRFHTIWTDEYANLLRVLRLRSG